MRHSSRPIVAALFTIVTLAACSATGPSGEDSTSDSIDVARSRHHDAGPDTGTGDAAATDSGAGDAAGGDSGSTGDDGAPTRIACTGAFGSSMTTAFGRLDGFLVSIVDPGQGSSCNGDAHHVHLQVRMQGDVYDIAVNVDSSKGSPNVDFLKVTAALQGGAWSEGWHPQAELDYANDLSIHAGDFTTETPSQLTNDVVAALASANHISVFATGFSRQGGHLIHRNGSGHDGALVIEPLSSSPQYLLFHFQTQTF